MVALQAVVAGEVALERRQDRDPELGCVLPDVVEELLKSVALGLSVFDHEAVLGKLVQRRSLLHVEAVENLGRGLEPVEQPRHVGRHDELRVGERVHDEHVVPIRQGDLCVEDGRLHSGFSPINAQDDGGGTRRRTSRPPYLFAYERSTNRRPNLPMGARTRPDPVGPDKTWWLPTQTAGPHPPRGDAVSETLQRPFRLAWQVDVRYLGGPIERVRSVPAVLKRLGGTPNG